MLITIDALYWFFSTIAQTLGALVGVVGMLTVFKLQSIANHMQQIVDSTLQQRNGIFPNGVAYTQTPKDIIIDFRKKYPDINIDVPRKDFRTSGMLEVVYLACLRILNSKDRHRKIRHRFLIYFLTPQLCVILFSLEVLIYNSEKVVSKLSEWSYSFSWWVVPLFISYLLASTGYMIISLMETD